VHKKTKRFSGERIARSCELLAPYSRESDNSEGIMREMNVCRWTRRLAVSVKRDTCAGFPFRAMDPRILNIALAHLANLIPKPRTAATWRAPLAEFYSLAMAKMD